MIRDKRGNIHPGYVSWAMMIVGDFGNISKRGYNNFLDLLYWRQSDLQDIAYRFDQEGELLSKLASARLKSKHPIDQSVNPKHYELADEVYKFFETNLNNQQRTLEYLEEQKSGLKVMQRGIKDPDLENQVKELDEKIIDLKTSVIQIRSIFDHLNKELIRLEFEAITLERPSLAKRIRNGVGKGIRSKTMKDLLSKVRLNKSLLAEVNERDNHR